MLINNNLSLFRLYTSFIFCLIINTSNAQDVKEKIGVLNYFDGVYSKIVIAAVGLYISAIDLCLENLNIEFG